MNNGMGNISIYSFAVSGNYLFAGTLDGVYKSTNNGTTWTQTPLNNYYVRSLAVNGNYVFAGTRQYGVYVSNNNGVSWKQKNEGLGNTEVRAFCILNNYIFAGTLSNGVYRRPLGEHTGIQPISNEIPNQYSLSQNYPNPFNPSTKIRFDISGTSVAQTFPYRVVNLSVYNILGKEITSLVNEQLQPGTYEVDWDGTNYPSGIYYFTLSVGQFTETRKAVLIK